MYIDGVEVPTVCVCPYCVDYQRCDLTKLRVPSEWSDEDKKSFVYECYACKIARRPRPSINTL